MEERRQCPQCGTDVEPDDSVCPFCDTVLRKTVPLARAASRGCAQRPALKACPHCGTAVTARAQSCPQCGCPHAGRRRPTRSVGGTLASILIGGLGMFVLFNLMEADRRGAKAPLSSPRVVPGGRAVLACKGGDGAYVAFGIKAWSRMAHAQVRRDTAEMERLVEEGQIALVADGTPLEVIGSGTMMYQLRVLAGPHEGREGWVRKEFVRSAAR
jgi:RNA polymerase subunit RPABC4/transcription elongation factor Spt4